MRLVEGKPLASGHIGLIRGTQYLWHSQSSLEPVLSCRVSLTWQVCATECRISWRAQQHVLVKRQWEGAPSWNKGMEEHVLFPSNRQSRDAPVLLKVSSCATRQWDHHRERISVRQKHGWLVLCSRPLSQKEKIRHTFPRIDKNSPEVRFVTARRYGSCVVRTFNC